MDYRQDKAIDIIEILNELDINWVDILIPVINNPNWKLTDYIIANYEYLLTEEWIPMRRGYYYSLIDDKIYDEFKNKYLTNEEAVKMLNQLKTQNTDLQREISQLKNK